MLSVQNNAMVILLPRSFLVERETKMPASSGFQTASISLLCLILTGISNAVDVVLLNKTKIVANVRIQFPSLFCNFVSFGDACLLHRTKRYMHN